MNKPQSETLKQALDHKRTLYKETGHCYGIQSLELKEQDPIKYEHFYSRLLATVMGGRELARMISSSPATREVAELAVCLQTPEGDAVVFSAGLTVHIPVMGDFIEWMIDNNYETDPGINEGDHFACNEPLIANVHVPDNYFSTPVYYEGEIVAWVSSVTHNLDVGGATPGSGMSIAIVNRFMEGLHLPGEKVATGDKLKKEYETRIRLGTRAPRFWLMDDRSRLAANTYVRKGVKEIMKEFGLDYFKRCMREIVEEARQYHTAVVKERLMPGRYRGVTFFEALLALAEGVLPYAKRNHVFHIPLEVRIDTQGHMVIDCEGLSPEGMHNCNCSPGGMKGGLTAIMVQLLHFNGKANDGSIEDIEFRFPVGTLVNPQDPSAAYSMAWMLIYNILSDFTYCLSHAFYTRGYVEEVIAGTPSMSAADLGGIDHFGRPFGGVNFEVAAASSGARAIIDGLNACYATYNPETDAGAAEVWELVYPHLYLGRGTLVDSGSPGRYRSGVCFASTWMWANTPCVIYSPMVQPTCFHQNCGMYGGYPGIPRWSGHVINTDMKQRIEAKLPLPHRQGDPRNPDFKRLVKGDYHWREYTFNPPLLKSYDLTYYPNTPSGGGLGDPIERDVKLVEQDFNDGFISQEAAERSYGVIASFDDSSRDWHVDLEATKARRAGIRQERLRRSIPVKEWWKKEREQVQRGEFPEDIANMYQELRNISPTWYDEFAQFWALERQ